MLKVLKGMKDVLPAESARWRALEREMRKAALMAGYREIRTPVLEHTELFARSAGESSDVVRKEMYTFLDKGDRSVTLKPESTAGTVRAFLESGLYAQALPLRGCGVDLAGGKASGQLRIEKPVRAHQFHRLSQLPSSVSESIPRVPCSQKGPAVPYLSGAHGNQPYAHAGLQGGRLQTGPG